MRLTSIKNYSLHCDRFQTTLPRNTSKTVAFSRALITFVLTLARVLETNQQRADLSGFPQWLRHLNEVIINL